MKSLRVAIFLVLCASLAFTLWLEEGAAQPPIAVAQPPSSRSPLVFKQVSLEVKVVNSTYAEFTLSASILNTSNQTLQYMIEVSTSTGYISYYPFTPSQPSAKQEFGVEITSEKLGKLSVKVDRSTAAAFSSLEAEGDDRIRLDGWLALTQIRYLIWREYLENYVSFSFRPEVQYEAPTLASETDLQVTFTYTVEYTKADEANYRVEIADGYKTVRYSERFYGGYGLSLNLYKQRIPVTSLIVFSALWILLIAVVVTVRRRQVKD